LSTFRWSIILKKDINIPYLRLLSIYFVGMFFNNFLPTMVGGDLVKGYYLYKQTKKGDVALASIFMDRYSGFAALMVITAIALIPGYALIKGTGLPAFFVLLIGGFLAISLVIWVGFLHRWAMEIMAKIHFYGINKKIDTFYKALMSYKAHYGILVKIFICSLFVQVGVIVGYYVLGRGIGVTVPIAYYFLFIPLVNAVAMLPVSLSGLGLREGAFVFLFTRVGANQEQALTISLMWFVIAALVSVIGGIEYVRMGGKKEIAVEGDMEGRGL
ncbi:MAG: lysylphosphatidylglycerol synthase transmembrane domain-containing protein, partial [Deltaproteobacteria bacterium]|nr:lysylphosphatidylglycerol synthase transmembrane domain-containing protein [Deltaproteobacteria bacterium]